jgi:hypothetical protein
MAHPCIGTVPLTVAPAAGESIYPTGSPGKARYVNRSEAPVALVWPPTVTVTSTVPLPAGLVALQLVVEPQLTPVAVLEPKRTVVAPAAGSNPVPVIVTTVPPACGPLVGLSAVTVGGGM